MTTMAVMPAHLGFTRDAPYYVRKSARADLRVAGHPAPLAHASPIQLSNSQVSRIDKRLRPRGGFSARAFLLLFPFPSSRKRKRSAVTAHVSFAALTESTHRSLRRPVSPYGAPPRCLKSPGTALSARHQDITPGPARYSRATHPRLRSRPGGFSNVSRDHDCESWARAPLPCSRQFSVFLQVMRENCTSQQPEGYSRSNIKSFSRRAARPRPQDNRAGLSPIADTQISIRLHVIAPLRAHDGA